MDVLVVTVQPLLEEEEEEAAPLETSLASISDTACVNCLARSLDMWPETVLMMRASSISISTKGSDGAGILRSSPICSRCQDLVVQLHTWWCPVGLVVRSYYYC